jgi:flagellar hook-basal body complex protein FliE
MSIAISSISNIVPAGGVSGVTAPVSSPGSLSPSTGGGFASALEGAIQSVEQPGQQADKAVQSFLSGDGAELHNVALSVQRASLAFDLGLQVRNKIVSAYQEVMKMQI